MGRKLGGRRLWAATAVRGDLSWTKVPLQHLLMRAAQLQRAWFNPACWINRARHPQIYVGPPTHFKLAHPQNFNLVLVIICGGKYGQ